MKFYTLEPEVAGGWGEHTVFTRTPGKSVVVHKLHYEFAGWLGDELLESSPCFIATVKLAGAIQRAGLTGAEIGEVEITTSDEFAELDPNRELPQFVWLKIVGQAGSDDFGLDQGHLVASEAALQVLKTSVLEQCEIADYKMS